MSLFLNYLFGFFFSLIFAAVRLYRGVKCLITGSLLVSAFDNRRAAVKILSLPACTSHRARSLSFLNSRLHLVSQWVLLFWTKGNSRPNGGKKNDWGSSTLLRDIKLVRYPSASHSSLQQNRAQMHSWTQVKCVPLSVASSWVMSRPGKTRHSRWLA